MRTFAWIILLLSMHSALGATTLTYKAINGKPDLLLTYTIAPQPQGHQFTVKMMEKGKVIREHSIAMDATFSTLKWHFAFPQNDLVIDAYRKGKEIVLTGVKKGKKTEKVFEVGDKPWKQIFPTGLEAIATKPHSTETFWAIGIEGISEMQIGEFLAKNNGDESIETPMGKQDCALMSLGLTGWKSYLWSGKSWHRKSDGRMLAVLVGRDIGTWELISEKIL